MRPHLTTRLARCWYRSEESEGIGMEETAKQASRVIESTATAVANWTVERQAELVPDLADKYGSRWRSDWVGQVAAQLRFLAQAIAVRRPEVFSHSVEWARDAFRARGVRDSDLLSMLHCFAKSSKPSCPRRFPRPHRSVSNRPLSESSPRPLRGRSRRRWMVLTGG